MMMNRPQGVQEDGDRSGPGDEEIMKKAEEAGKPGPAHQALEHFVGDWTAEVKCWREPNDPPCISQATAKGAWTLNGRFVQEDFHGDLMGRRYNGRGLLGYDNIRQTFNSVWMSDMQTSMFVTEGRGEDGNTIITLEGTASCPIKERGDIPMKVVLRVLGPDKHTCEMFDVSGGDSRKTMEITYLRA